MICLRNYLTGLGMKNYVYFSAYCILDNRRLRNMVIDELNELSSFCKMRSIERSQEKNFFLNDNLLASNEENSNIWMASHNEINSLIDELNGPGTIRTLHLVKTSTTFVNRYAIFQFHDK